MTSLILAILIGWGGVMPVHVLSTEGTSEPIPATQLGTVAVGGWATWYRYHEGQAAAGPALRRAIGSSWRGTRVIVSAGGRHVVVRLTDWCACGKRHGRDTVIDLDNRDFAKLAPLSRGVVIVGVEYGTPDAPETDVE